MMKKVMAITLSLIMMIAAIPAGADVTVIPASVDIYEALDNFTAQEMATTYTSANPYSEGGFVAPAGINNPEFLNAKVYNDDDAGDYVRILPSSEVTSAGTSASVEAGASILNGSLNLGIGENNNTIFTANLRVRNHSDNRNLFIDLVDNGTSKLQLFKWWYTNRLDYNKTGSFVNSGFTLADDVWYDLSITIDISTGYAYVEVDGGNYYGEKKVFSDFKTATSGKTYTGIRIGYATAIDDSEYFDVANISISNVASFEYDEKLTFEHTALSPTATSWKSGNWSIGGSFQVTALKPTAVECAGIHDKAIAIKGGGQYNLWFVHTIPDGTVGSDGVLVVEGSYFEEDYSYLNIELQGVKSDGTTEKYYPLSTPKTSEWAISCIGSKTDDGGKDMALPQRSGWVKVRVISNLKTDTLTLQYWLESDPTGTLVTATRAGALADYEDINKAWIKVWSTADGYQYIDDLRVYTADTLRYTGSYPANGEGCGVSVMADPSLIFNMPVASYTGEVILKDSDGNAVAGEYGLNAQRNGVAFYPRADLKEEETYTLDFEGTVTDVFGQTLSVDKTITFTTEPIITLVGCEFKQNDVTAETITLGADLAAEVYVKCKDKEKRNIYIAHALYNSATHQLEDIAIYADTAAEISQTLTNTVPASGAYYAKIFIWNADTSAPYFAAKTLGN